MNSRIFKKQNKRAMQKLLALSKDGGHHCTSTHFHRSEKGEDWCVSKNFAKRFPSHEIADVYLKGTEIESWHIKLTKGTPMFGEMSGYYEPEWDERPAVEELVNYEMVNDADYWEKIGSEFKSEEFA